MIDFIEINSLVIDLLGIKKEKKIIFFFNLLNFAVLPQF